MRFIKYKTQKIRWMGNVCRMEEGRMSKVVIIKRLSNRRRGRSRRR